METWYPWGLKFAVDIRRFGLAEEVVSVEGDQYDKQHDDAGVECANWPLVLMVRPVEAADAEDVRDDRNGSDDQSDR